MTIGLSLALLGAALAVILGGIGSAIGVKTAGEAGAGVLSETPEKFSKVLLLQALPATQGIYGFIAAFLIILKLGLLGGDIADISMETGLMFLAASLPVGLTGLTSGMAQGKVSAAGMAVVAKQPEATTNAMVLSVMVETYAILGLLITLLAIINYGA